MEIVFIFNGLGNQMSQYSFYMAKKKRSMFSFALYDKSSIHEHNGYELDKAFGIISNKLLQNVLYWIFVYWNGNKYIRPLLNPFVCLIKEPLNYDYTPSLLCKGKKLFNYYWGGWHSEKYFSEYRSELLETFSFKKDIMGKENTMWERIIKSDLQSVSIHVRRGDYTHISKDDYYQFNDVATIEYYKKAICYIKKHIDTPPFFVFSDDPQWCRELFHEKNFTFIDYNTGLMSKYDMYLMSLCRHHINANSTFSWWGAWLCKYEDSIVIVPKDFIRGVLTKDLYPEKWIKI